MIFIVLILTYFIATGIMIKAVLIPTQKPIDLIKHREAVLCLLYRVSIIDNKLDG